jgi:hypothetical protein
MELSRFCPAIAADNTLVGAAMKGAYVDQKQNSLILHTSC